MNTKKIRLIQPPPAMLRWPSIGLAQLKAMLKSKFSDEEVDVKIEFLNYPFAEYLGIEAYNAFTETRNGIAYPYLEWMFRHIAFPDAPDNQKAFFEREQLQIHRIYDQRETIETRKKITYVHNLLSKREGMEALLEKAIFDAQLDQADLIGFSAMFNQNLPILAMARLIRKINPKALILIGGCNCESPMGQELIQNFPDIDFVFSGPALISLEQFVRHWLAGETEDMKKINGVFHRDNLHFIGSGKKKEKVETATSIAPLGDELNLNDYPALDYDDFIAIRDRYAHLNLTEAGLFLETSRGCWWGMKAHCTFCGLNPYTMDYHAASYETARKMLYEMVEKYGHRISNYATVDSIMPQEFPEKVFADLNLPYDVNIFYEVKSNLTRKELEIMKEAGVVSLQPGIESFNSGLLKLMRKGVSSTQNIRFLRDVSDLQLDVHWNLLLGFPNESEAYYKQYIRQIPMLVHLHPPDQTGCVSFTRYSPYFNYPETFGLDLVPNDFYLDLYPGFDRKKLQKMVYFFQDQHNVDSDYAVFRQRYMAELTHLVTYWQDRYFGSDEGQPAVLHFEGAYRIKDTRGKTVHYHILNPLQSQILKSLENPMNVGKLQSEFPDSDNFEEDLGSLLRKGLIFHENMGSLVSLVSEKVRYHGRERRKFSFY